MFRPQDLINVGVLLNMKLTLYRVSIRIITLNPKLFWNKNQEAYWRESRYLVADGTVQSVYGIIEL